MAVDLTLRIFFIFSPLTLTKLVAFVCKKLEHYHRKSWSSELVTSKIKVLAKRKATFHVPSSTVVDIFEDEAENRMWRWEIITLELLPTSMTPKVRKARAARKKLHSHHSAILRLINLLQETESLISQNPTSSFDAITAKISREEEKVLKFEREAEKQRLAQQAQRKKLQDMESKKKEKELALEEKKKEKERKRQEAEQKKMEVEKQKYEAREEAKRKKAQEREDQKRKEELLSKEKLQKQKACLMSFLSTRSSGSKESKVEAANPKNLEANQNPVACADFDSQKFWSIIDAEDSSVTRRPMFPTLSRDAILSRKRRTRRVPVSVYVTVMPDEIAFEAQPFAEQRIIMVPNKYRFLSFHEDCRPPYHGTWSRKSNIITGKNPFGKDTSGLDYEVDSEAEWEEGDDEIGEDVEDDEKNQEEEDMDDEEGDPSMYNFQDGFCVADELALDEDADEETKLLYQKKIQSLQRSGGDQGSYVAIPNKVGLVAPLYGAPFSVDISSEAKVIEGMERQEALDLIECHKVIRLMDANLCLDAFPPALVDEADTAGDSTPPAPNSKIANEEYTREEMQTLARFIHHNSLNSKDKLIEELRMAHPSSFISRAKALRKLDSIAIKKRLPNAGGVYWEVKKEILQDLQLEDLLVSFQQQPFCIFSTFFPFFLTLSVAGQRYGD